MSPFPDCTTSSGDDMPSRKPPTLSTGQCATLPDAVFAANGCSRRSSRRQHEHSNDPYAAGSRAHLCGCPCGMHSNSRMTGSRRRSQFAPCYRLCATAHSSDAAFGAVHRCGRFQSGQVLVSSTLLIHQQTQSQAMRWAIQSTMESSPVLTVGLIPDAKKYGRDLTGSAPAIGCISYVALRPSLC